MAYVFIGILTFGYAANQRTKVNLIECAAQQTDTVKMNCLPFLAPEAAGFAAGVAWPLYWSWDMFSGGATK